MPKHSTPPSSPSKGQSSNPNFQGFKGINTGFPLSGGREISNLAQLADWLVTQGASGQAAAGIASVVAGESTGDPEASGSGGRGLIGWTPPSTLPGQDFTGDPTRDMEAQGRALIAYGQAKGNWDSIIAMGNAQQAAQAWSADEAPAVPGSDIRAALIPQILQAMGSPYANAGSTQSNTSGGLLSFPSEIVNAFQDIDKFVKGLIWFTQPNNIVRIIAGIAAFFVLAAGVSALAQAAK